MFRNINLVVTISLVCPPKMATLKVTIHEARDLPVMDRATGLADPYVVVSLNAESYTTEIDTGTCNPVWNKDVRFDAANLLTLQEDPVEFRVFDHDILTRDDLIGTLFIDLNCILGRETPSLSGWFPLFDTMAGLRGELRVTLKVKFHAAENPTCPRVPSRIVRHIGNRSIVNAALRRCSFVCSQEDTRQGQECSPLSPSQTSPALQYQVDVEEFQPINYLRSHQPSLTTEEEGVHIFSMPRLDPSVFRVESVLPMVEELIVKADPEHSKFTNLRSSRATNEARMLQLFKLSGKVRRQLTRKVLELQCNAVLGYEERYDLEPNGIIVRACGTPCVLSQVKFEFHKDGTVIPVIPVIPALPPTTMGSTPLQLDVIQCNAPKDDGPTSTTDFVDGMFSVEHSHLTKELSEMDEKVLRNPIANPQHQRSPVMILTVSDVPCGILYHVGGLVSARSVKLVSKLKNKLSISQERDAWWSELREEVKYNARSLHCNAIIGYEEVAMYDHEDVVVLSICGTGVVLDVSWLAMRCGPENLYHRLTHRLSTGKSCSILHLYQGHRQGGASSHARHIPSRSSRRDESSGFLCTICRRKNVPEIILASCAVPLEMILDGQPVLVQAVVSKTKPNVKGAELALCLSQAIPFLEFSLHKQLIFKMQLERMNAAFAVKVQFAVGHDVVVATLTATACRVVGLPIPHAPKLEICEGERIRSETVAKLQTAVERSKQLFGRARKRIGKRKSQSGVGDFHDRTPQHETENNGPGSYVSDETEFSNEDAGSDATWVSSSSATDDEDLGNSPPTSEITEYTVVIDDNEEAELMVGMISIEDQDGSLRLDDIVVTIPYLPSEANRYSAFQERVSLSRRYSLQPGQTGSGPVGSGSSHVQMNTPFLNQCFTNARLSFLIHLRRLAIQKQCWSVCDDLRVFQFQTRCVFEPNTNDLHIVLDGLVCGAACETMQDRKWLVSLQNRSFDEAEALLLLTRTGKVGTTLMKVACDEENLAMSDARDGSMLRGSMDSPNEHHFREKWRVYRRCRRNIFARSNAPFHFPFVFRRDTPLSLNLNDPFAQLEGRSSVVDTKFGERLGVTEQTKRTGMVRRQVQALTNVLSATMRNFADRIGIGLEVPPATLQESKNAASENIHHGQTATAIQNQKSVLQQLLQPCARIPPDRRTLVAFSDLFFLTPLSYVAGHAVARYICRLSQHFIREAYAVYSADDLGAFYTNTDVEVHGVVRALVKSLGGNALLAHAVQLHEVWDSDGSGCAFLCMTVTGHVALMTKESVMDDAAIMSFAS